METLYHFSDRDLKVSEIHDTFTRLNNLLDGHRTSEGFSVNEFKIGNESVDIRVLNLITPVPMYFNALKQSEARFIEELLLRVGPKSYIEFTDDELLVASYLFVKNGELLNEVSVAQLMCYHYTGKLPVNVKIDLHTKCEESIGLNFYGEIQVHTYIDLNDKAHNILLAKGDKIEELYKFLKEIDHAGLGIGGSDCYARLREGLLHDSYIDPYTVASYCWLVAPSNEYRNYHAHAEWVYYLMTN